MVDIHYDRDGVKTDEVMDSVNQETDTIEGNIAAETKYSGVTTNSATGIVGDDIDTVEGELATETIFMDLTANTVNDTDVSLATETKVNASSLGSLKSQNYVPTDKGWAWMILLGAVLQMGIFIGFSRTSGIIFVEFQTRFGSSSSTTSLITTVQLAVYSVSALLVMTAGVRKLTCRTWLMIGSTLTVASYIITSTADDVGLLFFSHGVMYGIGTACMQPCAFAMVGQYFNKRRGLANSVAVSGGSLGGLVFAPLLTAMFGYYGYSGCMLIIAGIYLHGFVIGSLFRPVTFYARHRHTRNHHKESLLESVDNEEVNVISSDIVGTHMHACMSISNTDSNATDTSITTDASRNSDHMDILKNGPHAHNELTYIDSFKHLDSHVLLKKHYVQQTGDRNMEHIGSVPSTGMSPLMQRKTPHLYSSFEIMTGSTADIPAIGNKIQTTAPVHKLNNEERTYFCKRLWKIVASTLDITLLRNPMFVTFMLAAFVLCGPTEFVTVFLIPYASEIGIGKQDVSNMLTVCNAVGLFSRLVIGYLSDKGYFRRSTFTGLAAIISGVCAHLLRFYSTLPWLMFYSVITGVFGGVYFSLWAAVVVDYLSVARLQSCLGFTILCHAISGSATYAVVGYVRDVSGSYIIPFHIIGCLCFLGAGLMFALPLVEKAHKRRKQPSGDTDHP